MNYVQFHIGDWNSSTKYLTPLEKGIYLELLFLYYETEKPLVRSYFDRITRGYTEDEKRAFDFVISEFFVESDDVIRHNRCDKEIASYKEKSEKARKSVQTRWERASKKKEEAKEVGKKDTDVIRPYNDRKADELLTNNQEPITNNQEYIDVSKDTLSAEDETPVVLEPKNPVQRLASHCPHEKLISLYQQEMPQNPVVRSWNSPARKNSMQARWRAIVSDKKFEDEASALEWFRRFFEYCNRSAFLRGDATPTADGRTFIADLEWLMKPSNFDKVIDGKYHH